MNRRRITARAAARQRGMSLVELMIGVVIGLFMVSVMGAVYLGSKGTFVAQESTARLQENGRFAMDTIANDLRMSGFRGCLSETRTTPLVNTLNTPAALLYNFAEPTWGSRSLGGNWTPALPAPASNLSALPAGDILVIRRPSGTNWALTAEMTLATSPMTVTATPNITKGDLLMVADCAGGAVIQATNNAPGAAGSIEHQAGVVGMTPGVSTQNVGRTFAHDALVWRMQTVIYYLANSVRRPGQVSLWSFTSPTYDGAAQIVELVTGVERMAVTYGVDTNGDFAADRFQSADEIADWTQVVTARVEMLLSGSDNNTATQAQPYVFDGQSVVPADKRLRTVMSLAASLRNMVP
jgi:type IV pilus assembly protein PilW